ncbi:putative Membrane protein [Candidatus Sulfobium mesophilum]|uniref:Putative Membrane protein n=1 Tax=Candidatus Sulfobium mesophilum TaxID=2016548 RepID=A0A2U3QGV2_9BACT|nr:putative Membrane protein [Candidatus Sulfobium mesophilum]
MKINKIALFAIKLAVSALSLYMVFLKSDINQIIAMLRKMGLLPLLLASSLYVSSICGAAFRWKLLLPEKFTFRGLFSLYMIGSFFSTFLPGVIGGDVVKAYYLNKDAKKLSLTLASVFMDRYLGYVSLMIIGMTAYPFALSFFGGSVYKWLMPMIFIAFVIGSFLFFGLKLGKRFKTVSEFYEYFSLLAARKDIIAKTIGISLGIQATGFIAVAVLAAAIGENVPVLPLLVFLPIIITITSLPISISGLGVREGSFVLLLGLIGVKPAVATSISLSWFFSTFLGSVPGLVAYIRHTGGSDQKK